MTIQKKNKIEVYINIIYFLSSIGIVVKVNNGGKYVNQLLPQPLESDNLLPSPVSPLMSAVPCVDPQVIFTVTPFIISCGNSSVF